MYYATQCRPLLSLSGLSTSLIFSGAAVELMRQIVDRGKQESLKKMFSSVASILKSRVAAK